MRYARKKILQGEYTTQTIASEIGTGMPAYPTEVLPNPMVSSISRWHDKSWFLDNPTPGATAPISTINWDLRFEDGTNLLNVCHADLLEQFRRLAWSLFVAPCVGKALKPGSAKLLSIGLRELLRWMVKNHYARMSELDSAASQRYLDDCQARLDGVAQEDSLETCLMRTN